MYKRKKFASDSVIWKKGWLKKNAGTRSSINQLRINVLSTSPSSTYLIDHSILKITSGTLSAADQGFNSCT